MTSDVAVGVSVHMEMFFQILIFFSDYDFLKKNSLMDLKKHLGLTLTLKVGVNVFSSLFFCKNNLKNTKNTHYTPIHSNKLEIGSNFRIFFHSTK